MMKKISSQNLGSAGKLPLEGMVRCGGTKPYTDTPRPKTTPRPHHVRRSVAHDNRADELADLIIALHDELMFVYRSETDTLLHQLCIQYDAIRNRSRTGYDTARDLNGLSRNRTDWYRPESTASQSHY